MTNTHRLRGSENAKRAASIIAVTAAMPGTQKQIIKLTGLSRGTVYSVVKYLREQKQARVSKWLPAHGPSVAVISMGGKPDAVDRLPRLSSRELSARYTAKIKGSDTHDQRKASWRARHWLNKAVKKPATWLSALGAP